MTGFGATIDVTSWETRKTCFEACENECLKETGGVYIPYVTTYCTADCFDASGCNELPFTGDEPPPPEPQWHDVPQPSLPGPEHPTTSHPYDDEPSGTATKPKTKPKPSTTAPSESKTGGSHVGFWLFGLALAAIGGVWLMKSKMP